MKTKLILFFCLISLIGFSQNAIPKRYFDTKKVTTDTLINLTISDNYVWGLQGNWAGNDCDSAYVLIRTSIDGTNFVDYYNSDTTDITGATGSFIYEDYMTSGKIIQVKAVINDLTGGEGFYLNLWHNLKKP